MREIRVNLGCGNDYRESTSEIKWINVDIDKNVKADIYCDFIKNFPFISNNIDYIFCKNVFEHVPNPLNFLLEIKRVLKRGGKAVIITSNASYFIYHFPRKKAYHDFYNETHIDEDRHYFMFQRGHLVAFTKKVGLKIAKLEYYISNINPGLDRVFQKIMGLIIGKKFAYSDFWWEIEK